MPFEKNNTHGLGRIKGSKNIVSSGIKEAFLLLVNNNLEKLESDLDSLEPKDRIAAILSLAGYVIPRMKASEVRIEDIREQPLFNIQLEKLIDVNESDFNKALEDESSE